MNVQDIKDILTFAAFRPEPDDRTATWARRFPRRRTILLNIGRAKTTWAFVGKNGQIKEGGSAEGEFSELAKTHADEWRSGTDDGWCAVSINHRYVISLEANLSRKPGVQEVIRTNPRAALGARYERGKRYAVTHNPESVASILLACEEEYIKKVEATLKEHRLRAGRICCGAYAMLRRVLEATNDGKNNKAEKESGRVRDRLYVVCCEGSVCAMLQSGDLWNELRSRGNLYVDDIDPIFSILEPLIARLDPGSQVFTLIDSTDTAIVDRLRQRLPEMEVDDLTKPQHFWRLLADRPLNA